MTTLKSEDSNSPRKIYLAHYGRIYFPRKAESSRLFISQCTRVQKCSSSVAIPVSAILSVACVKTGRSTVYSKLISSSTKADRDDRSNFSERNVDCERRASKGTISSGRLPAGLEP
ncbi:uncharacterized protein AKAW2_51079S [Aspergillus luchuensis]|uniref:Uncharacterized protein n=1 Tax=Aspergillus kawachii TaxID=1069201 RepID=A0A7R7WD28_ASPKA|nr:uncharacterized protein AKAW2_51079S [Aspergillus luchuensis]BCS00738.1 hypothetical protein AKAW2_51079S [Aspergillus luchuensis]